MSGKSLGTPVNRIYLACDHAGYELKAQLSAYLAKQGYDVIDCGADNYDPADDYPAYCIAAGERVVADKGSLGIVIGGSGNGEQIAANKVPGVRAALAWNLQIAQLARAHNDANVVSIGARMHDVDEALAIVEAFITTPFSEESRHIRRIAQISAYEDNYGR